MVYTLVELGLRDKMYRFFDARACLRRSPWVLSQLDLAHPGRRTAQMKPTRKHNE